ncbi:LDCC motif putative metal-binding protein [Tissierella creatinophila]|uniref:Uncharacterized protein n=1 Tax=Tissierella creatinophila DSM 6911 TaxID=1123403 RepID=A0A1U7M3W3_TISCR|nr:LDCC motif putative metal-binding protein [Tissierella creatinophila]OLS01976.1 hypothetical protein TICRE_21180 [Tissierella creatinophila DSM 6911]
MKNIIKKWLEKLGEANKESFGTGRLDCCQLGRESDKVKVNNKKSIK